MNVKKLMAVVTAAAMVLSPMTALADDVTSNNTTTGAVEGSGSVDYVASDVYSVILPTSAQLSVYLDPQGLSTISNNNPVTLNDLATNAGKVVPRGTALMKNKSSVPIMVTTQMYINTNSTSVKLLSNNSVNSGTNENVYLYANSSANKTVDASGNDSAGNAFAAGPDASKLIVNGSVSGNSVTAVNNMSFALNSANYNVNKTTTNGKDTFSLVYDVSDNNFDSAAFQFNGLVNKNADWSEFNGSSAKTFAIDTIYTIKGLTATDYSTIAGSKYTSTYNQVFAASNTFTNSSDGTKFVLKPLNTVTSVTSVKAYTMASYTASGSSATPTATIASTNYTVTGTGNITLTKSSLSSITTGYYVIEFVTNNGTYTALYTVS